MDVSDAALEVDVAAADDVSSTVAVDVSDAALEVVVAAGSFAAVSAVAVDVNVSAPVVEAMTDISV